jgi:hypothetical protein
VVKPTVADDADAELLLPLIQFLTADSCAEIHSTAVLTTETLKTIALVF